jgi:hypothetical protein
MFVSIKFVVIWRLQLLFFHNYKLSLFIFINITKPNFVNCYNSLLIASSLNDISDSQYFFGFEAQMS